MHAYGVPLRESLSYILSSSRMKKDVSSRGQRRQSVNICARTPSSTVTSRASSASNGVTMYLTESNGTNFSEIISAKGRSCVELEFDASLFWRVAERFLRSFPGSDVVFGNSRVAEDTLEVTGEESIIGYMSTLRSVKGVT